MDTPWTFGLEPLSQSLELAPLLRRITGLALSLEGDDPALAALLDDLRAAEKALAERAPANPAPRIGDDPPADGRPYVDHARDVGAYNACFPEYEIKVEGARATGTVSFPIAFEGPPGVVHGGVIATFFDSVIQHHSCDVGVAGKTTSLHVDFRRPTPLATELEFEIDRRVDQRRIRATARLFLEGGTFCTATMEAVAGDRHRLPAVAPRGAR